MEFWAALSLRTSPTSSRLRRNKFYQSEGRIQEKHFKNGKDKKKEKTKNEKKKINIIPSVQSMSLKKIMINALTPITQIYRERNSNETETDTRGF